MTNPKLVNSISDSKKYKDLSYKTIENICNLFAYNEKKVREKLHQVWGAYYSTRTNFQKLKGKIDNNEISLLDLVKIHSSSKERFDEYKDIYNYIFSITNGGSVADLGSGFNPIFFILLDLPNIKYTSFDIDNAQQEFVQYLFGKYEKGDYKAIVKDVLRGIVEPVDIVLALKLLPVLDQISKEQTDTFLQNLKCKYLVVSFPNKSLGGKEKGMKQNYRDLYLTRIESFGYKLVNEKEYKNESVFIFSHS